MVPRLATTPCPPPVEAGDDWWMQRHREKLSEIERRGHEIDIVLLGDSITQGWEDDEPQRVWQSHFGEFETHNLGFSGDRTEHLLWRLQNGEVAELSPRLAILLIGTNNTGHRLDAARDTADGVHMILTELRQRLPTTTVLLLAVLPRSLQPSDKLRQRNVKVNSLISDRAEADATLFQDLGYGFIASNGLLDMQLLPDELHLSPRGYQRFANDLKPIVHQLMR